MDFADKLARGWAMSGSRLCVGLDPFVERFPARFAAESRPILAFNKFIVDAVGDLVCAFKPQAAHHAAHGAERDLEDTIAYIHEKSPHAVVILDAKRGDIGSTAELYAREAFDRYGADAVTVNPFMGDDSVLPFLDRPDRGAVVLCRTSNSDASRFQDAMIGEDPVYIAVARRAETAWNHNRNVMLVVGATKIDDMVRIRDAAPSIPFLVPGVGEQGGSAADVMRVGPSADGEGLVVSASRSILYAGDDNAIRAAAMDARRELRAI